jgi:hypothetical protein
MDSSKPKKRIVKMPVEEVVEVKPKKRIVKMPVEEIPNRSTVEEQVISKPKKRVVKMPLEEIPNKSTVEEQVISKPKKRVVKMPEEKKQIVFPIYETTSIMAEGDEEPIIVKKVYNITLEILSYDGKKYYLDKTRDKIYERLGDKKHGKYLGRWDSNSEEIITTVDSDSEYYVG